VITRRDLLKRVGAAALVPTVAPGLAAPKRQRRDGGSPAITIAGEPAELLITTISPVTTRISVVRPGAPIRGDGSLIERGWPQPVARASMVAGGRVLRPLRSGDVTVEANIVDKPNRGNDGRGPAGPALVVTVTNKSGGTVQVLHIDQGTGSLSFMAGIGPIFGLGEGGPQFDRRGSVIGPRSGQGGYQLRTHGGRVPVQWLIDSVLGALFIHQPYGTFDLESPGIGRFAAPSALPLDLFVVDSRDPSAVMTEYARLTGHPEMPPLWAFGYQQSHRTLASREEILEEAKTFREKKLPCETLIYLGTGFCPSGWNTDNGEFAFNPKVFPDPPAMIRQLHEDQFKVVLHIVLEGRTLTGAASDACTASPLPSGRTPDGKWPDHREVSCYWPVHKPLVDAGVDGWWPDQGDGLDPASRLARNRMYFDGSRQWRPNERPFALHRNGGAGMQRFGAFLWSGDVYSTWETLKTHVPVAINTGLSGIPYWGTDIGGFVPTKEFTGELYVRWFQFAAFCPLFRAHGRTWKLRLPWGWNTGELGPDEISNYTGGAANPDPSELHNAAVEPICRTYLELRSRLMPYLYSAVREGHETGLPIIRAMWLHYPADHIAVARGDQYLWGRDMLVAPVVDKGAASRRVYLPAGPWHDFWTEQRHDGGRELTRNVDLETMPLYVRGGAILPLGPVKQYVNEVVDEPMTLQIYPGTDGAFTLYEDDGASFDHERGEWMGIEMRWTDRERRLDVRLAAGSKMRPPNARRLRVRVAGSRDVRNATFTGTPLEVRI